MNTKPGATNFSWKAFRVIVFVAILSAFLFSFIAFLLRERGYIFESNDPMGYYVYTRSLFHDHDLDFGNEFQYFFEIGGLITIEKNSTTGKLENKYPIGVSLLIALFYSLACTILKPFYPDTKAMDVFPWFLDQAIFSIGGILVGFLGLWLSFVFVSSYFPERESLIATISFWACSPLLYYFIREPFMSHLPTLFTVSLFLVLWRSVGISLYLRSFAMGSVGALTTITRYQDCLIILIPVGLVILNSFRLPRYRWIKIATALCLYCLGFAMIFFLQMIVWKILYGSFMFYSYGDEGFIHWKNPRLFEVLFSSNHGLLSWHPLIGVCLLGLWLLPKANLHIGLLFWAWFFCQLYVTGSWWSWWLGSSFGSRAFISMTPAFILGLTALIQHLKSSWSRRIFFACVALLFLWNITLMLAYLSEMIPYEGEFSWSALIDQLPRMYNYILIKIESI